MFVDQKTAYCESAASGGDDVCFWRERRLDGLECLKAHFRRHRYLPHTHDTYAVGVITDGAEAFYTALQTHFARGAYWFWLFNDYRIHNAPRFCITIGHMGPNHHPIRFTPPTSLTAS